MFARIPTTDGAEYWSYGVMMPRPNEVVIYFPPRIDSTKTYPIIDHIYPGSQVGSVGSWSFSI